MDSGKFVFVETTEGRELSYPRQKSDPLFDELSVDYCSVKKYPEQWKSGDIQNEYFWELLCVSTGSFMLQQKEQQLHLKNWQALLVTPGASFCLKNESPDYSQIIRLGFHGGRMEKIFTAADLDKRAPICSNIPSKDILTSIDLILNSRNDGVVGALVRAREILNIIILFLGTTHTKNISQNQTDNIYIQSAVNFIDNHYSENIDVQSIADYLGISRTYFTILFQQITKSTPSRYLMHVRMKAAEHLLTNTDTLVSNVAERCGFSNAYSFSTSFRKRYGLSPTQYRKEKKENHE